MSTQTTNYGLIKPQLTDTPDITSMNDNWDIIDEKLKEAMESGGFTGGEVDGNIILTPESELRFETRDGNTIGLYADGDSIELYSLHGEDDLHPLHLFGLGTPHEPTEAVNKNYVDNHINNNSNPHEVTADQVGALSLTGGTVTGKTTFGGTVTVDKVLVAKTIDIPAGDVGDNYASITYTDGGNELMISHNVSGYPKVTVGTPVQDYHAATKAYVDNKVAAGSKIVVQTEEPTDKSVLWIDPDDTTDDIGGSPSSSSFKYIVIETNQHSMNATFEELVQCHNNGQIIIASLETTDDNITLYRGTMLLAPETEIVNNYTTFSGSLIDAFKDKWDVRIDSSSVEIFSNPVMPAVRYDVKQNLTDEQKTRARENMGVDIPTKISAFENDANYAKNMFSNVTVGSTTITADTSTDTLTLVAGSNITLTPDATNDKITIASNIPTASASILGGVKIGSNISISDGKISVPTASGTSAGVTIVYPAQSCTTYTSDTGTITPLAAQKAVKMFAITRPASSTVNAITRYSNTTGDVANSKIIIEDVVNSKDSSKKAQVIAIPAEGNKKMVYGYCTDQVDGTSFIGGVFDKSATSYPYSEGLAIGGTSGNLLWKGVKVATVNDIPTTSQINSLIDAKLGVIENGTY